jgi:hypothetical protein
MRRLLLVPAVVLLAVGGWFAVTISNTSRGLATAEPTVARTLPPGGLSQAAVEASIRATFGPGTLIDLLWAQAGPASEVMKPQDMEAAGVAPDRWVWSLGFDATSGPICPPDGSSCGPAIPLTFFVYVDYYTGETLSSTGSG